MTRLTAAQIGVSVILSALGQIILKAGVATPSVQAAAQGGSLPGFVLAIATSLLVWVGLVVYGLSVLLWLGVLTRIEVSTAYPFVALGMILTCALGYFIYGESMSAAKAGGILLIASGVLLVARSA